MAGCTASILVVDDDHDFQEIARQILGAQGYHVECAFSPAEALAMLEHMTPDLIVTDLMMNTLDSGFTFVKELRMKERFSEAPIVMVTAVGSHCGLDFTPSNDEDLRAMQIDAFFNKPYPPRLFLDKVRELLARRRPAEQ